MVTTARIIRFYRSLPPGTLFTTRQCLGMGLRAAVDKALSRLVNSGFLIRIVRGMFVCAETARAHYPVEEIAALKASSFGKRVRIHPIDAAAKLSLLDDANKETSFIVDGCTSKFHLMKHWIPVNLKTASEKKMHLPDNKAGNVVRALWQFGRKHIEGDIILKAALTLDDRDRQEIINASEWMPWWLSNCFVYLFGHRFNRQHDSISIRRKN